MTSALAKEVKDYSATIAEFKKIPVVAAFFESAHGYAVFPTVGKGGLGVGGSHGKGQVYRGGKAIGFTSTSDVSIGLQAGGQAYSQIIFFQDAASLDKFTSGNFEFAASASAIAVQGHGGGDRRHRGGRPPPRAPTTRRSWPGRSTRTGWRSSPWPRAV